MRRLPYCPKCKEGEVRRVLTTGRMNRFECSECSWKSKPFIPPTKPIKTTKTVYADKFYGWTYEVFDIYGQATLYSRTYNTREDAIEEMKKDIAHGEGKPYGPYTGILWPKSVEIQGEVFFK